MYFCKVARSSPPSRRTSSVFPSRMSSHVRCTTRPMPVSPTNKWCASSVSMKRQVRDSGSKPLAAGLGLGEEETPAVVRHLDVVELRPALGVDTHGGAQVHVLLLEAGRAHTHPPVQKLRMPLLERALEPTVLAQAHVVRDALAVVDARHHTLLRSNSVRWPD